MALLVGVFVLLIANTRISENIKTYTKKLEAGVVAGVGETIAGDSSSSEDYGTSSQADGGTNVSSRAITIGDKAIISSVAIEAKTGTGPWDDDDEPGNDSSEDNNIVRSFD